VVVAAAFVAAAFITPLYFRQTLPERLADFPRELAGPRYKKSGVSDALPRPLKRILQLLPGATSRHFAGTQ
jgi:hypothetical protein